MSECPVCTTTYLKGKSEHCHVCGWQFDSTSVSTIGPVKIKHQLSQVALTKMEAWARHMWTSLQQQKQHSTEQQTEPSPPARQLPTVTLRSAQGHRLVEQGIYSPSGTIAPHSVSPSGISTASLNTGMMPPVSETIQFSETISTASPQWILSQTETAQQERSQLQFQMSQLRAEVQRLQATISNAIEQPHPSQSALALQPDPSELEAVWQNALAQTQSELKQNIIQSQTHIQDAIAVLMQTHQVQQQTLLTQHNTLHTLQNQLHAQAQAHQEQEQRLVNLEQMLTTLCQNQQEQRTWLETKLPTRSCPPESPALSPTESDDTSTALQQLQVHIAALQDQIQQTQQQFRQEINCQFQHLQAQQVDTTVQIVTLTRQLQTFEANLLNKEMTDTVVIPHTVVGAVRPSHTVYTRYQ